MKRLVALLTVVMMSVAVVTPAVAIARGGPPEGRGPAYAPGQLKKTGDAYPDGPGPARAAERAGDDLSGKGERTGGKGSSAYEAAETPVTAPHPVPVAGDDEGSEVETSTPPGEADADEPADPGKRHGVAHALSRIIANIERAETGIEAGTRSHVPPGLLRVMAKFLGWLGIEAPPESVPDDPAPEAPGDTADDGTGDGGSADSTSTPEPPDSDEGTGTVGYPPAG